MRQSSEAPAPSRANAAAAGNEATNLPGSSQQFPTKDDERSHLRNALLLLELAAEYTCNGLHKTQGEIYLCGHEAADLINRIVATIALMDARKLAQTIQDFSPSVVAIDPRDPSQLALLVPPQSAPAFSRSGPCLCTEADGNRNCRHHGGGWED